MQTNILKFFGLILHLNLYKPVLDKKDSVINIGISVSFLLIYFISEFVWIKVMSC
jgi:hypothetical protein